MFIMHNNVFDFPGNPNYSKQGTYSGVPEEKCSFREGVRVRRTM